MLSALLLQRGHLLFSPVSSKLAKSENKRLFVFIFSLTNILIPIVLDDLTRKYQKGRWLRYEGKPAEWKAIAFVRKRKGWSDINPNWLPTTC